MRAPNRTALPQQATFSASVPGEITLSFPDNKHASALFGQYDQNLAKMERGLGVVANAIGNQVTIKGPPEACERARHVLQLLYDRIKLGQVDLDGRHRRRDTGGHAAGRAVPRRCRRRDRRQGLVRPDRNAPPRPGARPERGAEHLSARP